MNTLSNINIFEVIGVEEAPEEERNQHLARLSKISIARATERAMEDGTLSIDGAERIYQEVTDPIEIQNKLVELCPSLPQYVEYEMNKIKIEILQKQVEDIMNRYYDRESLQEATDLGSYLNLPLEEMDANILLDKVRAFRELQNKLLRQTNING